MKVKPFNIVIGVYLLVVIGLLTWSLIQGLLPSRGTQTEEVIIPKGINIYGLATNKLKDLEFCFKISWTDAPTTELSESKLVYSLQRLDKSKDSISSESLEYKLNDIQFGQDVELVKSKSSNVLTTEDSNKLTFISQLDDEKLLYFRVDGHLIPDNNIEGIYKLKPNENFESTVMSLGHLSTGDDQETVKSKIGEKLDISVTAVSLPLEEINKLSIDEIKDKFPLEFKKKPFLFLAIEQTNDPKPAIKSEKILTDREREVAVVKKDPAYELLIQQVTKIQQRLKQNQEVRLNEQKKIQEELDLKKKQEKKERVAAKLKEIQAYRTTKQEESAEKELANKTLGEQAKVIQDRIAENHAERERKKKQDELRVYPSEDYRSKRQEKTELHTKERDAIVKKAQVIQDRITKNQKDRKLKKEQERKEKVLAKKKELEKYRTTKKDDRERLDSEKDALVKQVNAIKDKGKPKAEEDRVLHVQKEKGPDPVVKDQIKGPPVKEVTKKTTKEIKTDPEEDDRDESTLDYTSDMFD